jgi:hypothetical protein
MDEDVTRRLVRGVFTLLLSTMATWLGWYLTERLLGPEPEEDIALEKGRDYQVG